MHTTNQFIILVDKELKIITGLRRYRSNYFRIDGDRKPAVMTFSTLKPYIMIIKAIQIE
jgi:hypothetical protein